MPDSSNMSDEELDLWSDINNPNNFCDKRKMMQWVFDVDDKKQQWFSHCFLVL